MAIIRVSDGTRVTSDQIHFPNKESQVDEALHLYCDCVTRGRHDQDELRTGHAERNNPGIVKDQTDLAVPGVTVTVTSPALQGTRWTVPTALGVLSFLNCRPGTTQSSSR